MWKVDRVGPVPEGEHADPDVGEDEVLHQEVDQLKQLPSRRRHYQIIQKPTKFMTFTFAKRENHICVPQKQALSKSVVIICLYNT